jgi:hypothetical protein
MKTKCVLIKEIQMENLYTQKTINTNSVFGHRFLDSKILYLYHFNKLPSVNFVNELDGEKAFSAFMEKFGWQVKQAHKFRWFKKKRNYQFDSTVAVLDNNCLVQFDNSYCEILHDGTMDNLVTEITDLVNQFRNRSKREPREINMVVRLRSDLNLKAMDLKRSKLDLDLYYEDDFKPVDELIRKRLNKKKDKGIVLLHGLPGTGKTTYLRYLVGKIRKRVLFLSPSAASELMNPEFMELLIDNPDTVLIIEDAENVISDRRYNNSSAVSNLLNISDGLLADFLNVQLICTFNSPLTVIDTALMRKGRLIARYEFKKLSIEKAQRLSDHLGFDIKIDQPMTIAEITNPGGIMNEPETRKEVIGFRTETMMN